MKLNTNNMARYFLKREATNGMTQFLKKLHPMRWTFDKSQKCYVSSAIADLVIEAQRKQGTTVVKCLVNS